MHVCDCIAELGELIQTTRGMIELFSKAKAAKLIRELVDRFLDMNKTVGNEVRTPVCEFDDLYLNMPTPYLVSLSPSLSLSLSFSLNRCHCVKAV